mmetsp:Transcript_24174/g.55967  ORF Transcript_24174/g.55967 Transcript_24174/m.55967 type:complete len:285 (-) Transcript_24174:9-863(-)
MATSSAGGAAADRVASDSSVSLECFKLCTSSCASATAPTFSECVARSASTSASAALRLPRCSARSPRNRASAWTWPSLSRRRSCADAARAATSASKASAVATPAARAASAAARRSVRTPRNDSMTTASKPWRSSAGLRSTAEAEARSEGSAPKRVMSLVSFAQAFSASFVDEKPPATSASKPASFTAFTSSVSFCLRRCSLAPALRLDSAAADSFSTAFSAVSASAVAARCCSIAASVAKISAAMASTFPAPASTSSALPSAAACASATRDSSIVAASAKTDWI